MPVFQTEKERHNHDEKVQKRGPIHSLLPQELRRVRLQDITPNTVNIIHQERSRMPWYVSIPTERERPRARRRLANA